jgi:hypothetical protein
MIQIRKTYNQVNPELLNGELKDFILKQGATLDENKLETFTLPDESADFVSRMTMTFKTNNKESLRVHLVGSARGETKLMIDVDEKLFSQEKLSALQTDLDFMFGGYEVKK